MKRFIIYGLLDPRIGEYRYIGKSSSGTRRPRLHAWFARRNERGHKANWIRSLLAEGLEYVIVVIEETTEEQLNARETWWITWYRPFGRLTNISDGGLHEGDVKAAGKLSWVGLSPEQRSARQRLPWARLSPEQRKERGKISIVAAQKALAALSPEQRSVLSRKGAGLGGRARREMMTSEEWVAFNRDNGRKSQAARTPEQRKKFSQRGGLAGGKLSWVGLSKEQRSERTRKPMASARAALTSEQLRENGRKGALALAANRRAKRVPRIKINLLSGANA